jgi:hypothetical protein
MEQFPKSHFELEPYTIHHDQLLSAWSLVGHDGAVLLTGHNYARVDRDGRIAHTAGFFKI